MAKLSYLFIFIIFSHYIICVIVYELSRQEQQQPEQSSKQQLHHQKPHQQP